MFQRNMSRNKPKCMSRLHKKTLCDVNSKVELMHTQAPVLRFRYYSR